MPEIGLKRKPMAIAALLHGLGWEIAESQMPIAPGITLMCPRGSRVCGLYSRLCESSGIDDGEPVSYEVAIVLEPPVNDLLDCTEPCSTLQLLCNVISVMTADVIGMSRVIWSRDSFLSASSTRLLSFYGPQTEFLQGCTAIDRNLAEEIAVGWRVLRHLIDAHGYQSRVLNALLHFSSASHAPYLDRVCLDLELALNIVFNSTSKDARSAEVAQGVSQLLDRVEVGSEDLPGLMKATFGVREELVKSGFADQEQICEYAPRAFKVTASVLRRLLLNEDLATSVNARTRRE